MLANNMRELMKKRGLTEMELAAKVGLPQQTINRLKNSVFRPRIETALRIARALRVPVERIWSLNDKTAA